MSTLVQNATQSNAAMVAMLAGEGSSKSAKNNPLGGLLTPGLGNNPVTNLLNIGNGTKLLAAAAGLAVLIAGLKDLMQLGKSGPNDKTQQTLGNLSNDSPLAQLLSNVGQQPANIPQQRGSTSDDPLTDILALLNGNGQSQSTGPTPNTTTGSGDPFANFMSSLMPPASNPGTYPNCPLGSNPNTVDDASEAYKEIDKNFDKLSGGKGSFSDADLKRAAGDASDPRLQAAAQFLLSEKSAKGYLDTADEQNAGKSSKADNVYSRGDVSAAMSKSKFSRGDQEAIQTVLDNKGSVFAKGTINKDDLQKLADTGVLPNGDKASPNLQEAAVLITGKKDLMDRLDSAFFKSEGRTGPQLDGKISLEDFRRALASTAA